VRFVKPEWLFKTLDRHHKPPTKAITDTETLLDNPRGSEGPRMSGYDVLLIEYQTASVAFDQVHNRLWVSGGPFFAIAAALLLVGIRYTPAGETIELWWVWGALVPTILWHSSVFHPLIKYNLSRQRRLVEIEEEFNRRFPGVNISAHTIYYNMRFKGSLAEYVRSRAFIHQPSVSRNTLIAFIPIYLFVIYVPMRYVMSTFADLFKGFA